MDGLLKCALLTGGHLTDPAEGKEEGGGWMQLYSSKPSWHLLSVDLSLLAEENTCPTDVLFPPGNSEGSCTLRIQIPLSPRWNIDVLHNTFKGEKGAKVIFWWCSNGGSVRMLRGTYPPPPVCDAAMLKRLWLPNTAQALKLQDNTPPMSLPLIDVLS